jgi:tetratricopeptide (TPR) repeat protein
MRRLCRLPAPTVKGTFDSQFTLSSRIDLMVVSRKRLALQAAFFFGVTSAVTFAQDSDLAAESHHAKELMAEHRFAEAIPIYQDLLKAFPGNTGLLLDLALAEEMAGQPARAVPHFEAVLKVEPDAVPALMSLSIARLQLNQSREAIAPLRKLIQLDPNNLNAIGMLAEAEMSQKLFEEAAGHYREVTERDGADPRAWYGLGKAYESLANRTFDRLNQIAPESPYVALLLADTRVQRHQYRSAFFFYRQAQSKAPDLPGIHAGLAEIYRNTGHVDWATTETEREETLPRPDCKVQTAECAFLSQHFVDTVKGVTASPAALFWATKAYNALAVQAFDRLSQLPDSVEIHAFKAQILRDHKQNLEAANEWRAALKLSPGDAKIKRQLAAALFDAKDYRAAMPLVEDQLATEPSAPDLNYLMGASLFRTEQAEKALPYLQLAVQGHTDNLAADAALGLTLVSLNKTAEAIPYLKKALPLDDDGSVHYSLARAYRAAGESQLAAETMLQYQKIQKQNQEINAELAKQAEITAPSP